MSKDEQRTNLSNEHMSMSDKERAYMSDTVLTPEVRAEIVNDLKHQLQRLTEQRSNVLEALSPNVRKRVDVLRDIQSQYDELEAKFIEERAALEAKYLKLYQPFYAMRYDVVNGIADIEETGEDSSIEVSPNGVPSFWLTALKSNETLTDEITERDESVLKYLRDIKCCRLDCPKGFKLEFFFDPNPYFKNSVLTKTYNMIDGNDPVLEKAIGTKIEWHRGKILTQKVKKKKPKRGSMNPLPIPITEKCESFFNFFNPPTIPEDDIDDDVVDELQNALEQDYEIGYTIRDKIIPHAVSWFTGEALGIEAHDDGDGHDGKDGDDDDDDSKAKKKSGNVRAVDGQNGVTPPDCKQQ